MTGSETGAARTLLEDERLMARVSGGDVEAFGEIYDRYCARAFRVARAVCRDEGRAEDAVQEAFFSVWSSRSTYQSQRGALATWLLTVVRYRAIDIERRNSAHATNRASDDTIDALPGPGNVSEDTVARSEAANLRSLLADLPDAQREVITLAFYGQLSHSEIARQLGLPDGTVKGRMRLGLQKLRGHVDQVAA